MLTTYGVFVFNVKTQKLLIGKATGGNNWSIPKGLKEEGESSEEAARREVKEETGIDLTELKLTEGKEVIYRSKKKELKPFFAKVKVSPEEVNLHCSSLVKLPGRSFPEICEFRWVTTEEFAKLAHEAQA